MSHEDEIMDGMIEGVEFGASEEMLDAHDMSAQEVAEECAEAMLGATGFDLNELYLLQAGMKWGHRDPETFGQNLALSCLGHGNDSTALSDALKNLNGTRFQWPLVLV